MYVALSGQMAMQERLMTVAHNVANMRTAGFRAETVDFDTVYSDYRRDRVAFASSGKQHIDRRAGPVEGTGNPLDVAISGDAWFGIDTPAGRAYTRDGRFTVNPFGALSTLSGHTVVDEGGAPIAIDPDGGRITIGVDGRIEQNGNVVGVLGLFEIPEEANLSRYGDSALFSDVPADPVLDRTANGVRQGFREGANVDPVKAIVELIAVQRAFDHATTAVRDRQGSMEEAVRILGGR
jgi:flagellar basal-body rod protein FlgF